MDARYRSAAVNATSRTTQRDLAFPAIAAVATAVGLALRFVVTGTPLWLDEAQSVAIVDGAFGSIVDGLERDGHPPLYYWLLDGWIGLVGDGDGAVRLLSSVFGVLAVVVIAVVADRLGGRRVAVAATALAATSPFLVRYSTEARMYALVTALAGAWWLAGEAALRRSSRRPLAGVALTTGALVLTHYWAFFLLAGGALVVGWRALRGPRSERPAAQRVLAAAAVGTLPFAVWLPSFLTQLRHTGTPWAVNRNPVAALVAGLVDLAGDRSAGHALALFGLLVLLVAVGTLGRSRGPRVVELDLTARTPARPLASLVAAVVVVGLGVTALTGSAFAPRYFAVITGFVLVIAARGVAILEHRLAGTTVLAACCLLGLLGSLDAVRDDRSQGREVAHAVATDDAAGDLVVACPDQLGPATARYLPPDVELVVYPSLSPGTAVDWTDYAERNVGRDPVVVAADIEQLAGSRDIWLVWRGGYRTFDDQCERLLGAIASRRGTPDTIVTADAQLFEPMNLVRFAAPAP